MQAGETVVISSSTTDGSQVETRQVAAVTNGDLVELAMPLDFDHLGEILDFTGASLIILEFVQLMHSVYAQMVAQLSAIREKTGGHRQTDYVPHLPPVHTHPADF